MGATLDEHLTFWRTLEKRLSGGWNLIQTINDAKAALAGTELAKVTAEVAAALEGGKSFSDAMAARPDAFSRVTVAMVCAGEVGGVLDVIVHRMEEQPPVRRLVNTLILGAIQRRASDIHVDPLEGDRSRLRVRVDGVLHDAELPEELPRPADTPHREVVNRIKVMAGMDVAERRLPQDGRIVLNMSGKPMDLRVSTLPTYHGERVVMRILARERPKLNLDDIGLLDDDLATMRELSHRLHGIILAAGPTGSGKTTLFYAMLNEIDRDHTCVLTVEDPIEYLIEGVAQTQIATHIGLAFPRAIRQMLRQDPDVMLIGELREGESANLAAQCALTGHLVLTSLHADTAPGGIKRLVDMGVAPFVVNASLAASISQRLIRTLCPDCKKEVKSPRHLLSAEAADMVRERSDATFYAPAGCPACNGTGYRGRTAIHEILIPDDRVKDVVASDGSLAAIREAALAAGMRTMLACGVEKAARGITSLQEVLRVIPHGPND